jgi:hypothetical protein
MTATLRTLDDSQDEVAGSCEQRRAFAGRRDARVCSGGPSRPSGSPSSCSSRRASSSASSRSGFLTPRGRRSSSRYLGSASSSTRVYPRPRFAERSRGGEHAAGDRAPSPRCSGRFQTLAGRVLGTAAEPEFGTGIPTFVRERTQVDRTNCRSWTSGRPCVCPQARCRARGAQPRPRANEEMWTVRSRACMT